MKNALFAQMDLKPVAIWAKIAALYSSRFRKPQGWVQPQE